MDTPKADMLFEASWEVCNKVGGIYTVVRSKAAMLRDIYKDYYLIGPLFPNKAKLETQQVLPPEHLKAAITDLEREGIVVYYGKWYMKGEPNVILIDYKSLIPKKNEIKKWLWDRHKIDSLFSQWEFEEPMLWSYAVARFLDKVAFYNSNKKIVGHFHEWLAGFSILYLKDSAPKIKTVFTTHATMLGRAIAGSGGDLYSMLDHINPEEEAKKHNIMDKFTTERACANNASVFTTVSEITSIEAEKLLGKKADILVLNGLDIERFPTFEENSIKHRLYRDLVREFIGYYFFPYYTFNMDETLIFYMVGRYEFKNKGIDLYIKSLAQLNQKLKDEKSNKTVIAFIWVPTGVHGIKGELLENEEIYKQIIELVDRNERTIKNSVITNIVLGKDPTISEMLDKEFMNEIKQHMVRFKKQGSPGLTTHAIQNEDNDAIIRACRENGLLNREEDKVKVIFYPVYLDGSDGLINLMYYDALVACHFGVFPSYYEPWGYTPLESGALGIPAVTTDLAGFGRFIQEKPEQKDGGIYVLKRFNRPDSDVAKQLYDVMYNFVSLHQKDRVKQKILAKKLAEYADWKELIVNYIDAHNLALKK